MSMELLGRKTGMTQWFDEEGRAVPATVLCVEPAVVVGIKSAHDHGYTALQLGAGEIPERKLAKPVLGVFRKAGLSPRRHLFGCVCLRLGSTASVRKWGWTCFPPARGWT